MYVRQFILLRQSLGDSKLRGRQSADGRSANLISNVTDTFCRKCARSTWNFVHSALSHKILNLLKRQFMKVCYVLIQK